jgi:hypothetical protein
MLESTIPVKTAAGRLEIDERKLKIGARQRMVLISINGERTVESIRKQFVAINEIDSLLDELLATGLIEVGEAAAGSAVAPPISSALPEAPVAAKPALSEAAATPVSAPVSRAGTGGDLATARDFMSRMLNAKVGLRAFLVSQKIDKSTTREALIELLPEFRRLLRKHVDAGRVAEFSAHAEELIG